MCAWMEYTKCIMDLIHINIFRMKFAFSLFLSVSRGSVEYRHCRLRFKQSFEAADIENEHWESFYGVFCFVRKKIREQRNSSYVLKLIVAHIVVCMYASIFWGTNYCLRTTCVFYVFFYSFFSYLCEFCMFSMFYLLLQFVFHRCVIWRFFFSNE